MHGADGSGISLGPRFTYLRKDPGSLKGKMKMKKGCRRLCIGGFFLLALTALAGIAYVCQDFIVFQPNAVPLDDEMAPVPHENVYISTKDGVKLNLILLPYTEGDSSPLLTILYFHGNAGSIYGRVFNAMQLLVKLKANVVLVEYRGFGKSEGKPSEEGLYRDAEASLDFVMTRPDLNDTQVVLFGRSLGGAVAVRLASVNPHRVAAIIVENTFLSIPHMAAALFPFLPMRFLPLWYYKNQFLSYQQVAQCHMPSLFVSGLSDRLIPPAMMKQLYELSPAKIKRLATFPGGTHMNTRICPGYFPALEQFVKDMLKSHALEDIGQTSAPSNSSQILT